LFLVGLYAQETQGIVVVTQQGRKQLLLTLVRAALLMAPLAELLVAELMLAAQIFPAEQAAVEAQDILAQEAGVGLLTQEVRQALAAGRAVAAAGILCVAKKVAAAAVVLVCMVKGHQAHNQRLVMA
jgi:hypothetical protein